MSDKNTLKQKPAAGGALVWLENYLKKWVGGELKAYVKSETGKGLSEENFTRELKAKLDKLPADGVAGTGEVDWANIQNIPSDLVYTKDLPEIPDAPTWATLEGKPDDLLHKGDLAGVYKYAGQVATYDELPTAEMTDETVGWTYDVKDTGMNWAWNGKDWDNLGQLFSFDPLTDEEMEVLFATEPDVPVEPDPVVAAVTAATGDVGGFTQAELINSGALEVVVADGAVTLNGDAAIKAVEAKTGESRLFMAPLAFAVEGEGAATVTITADKWNETYTEGTYSDTFETTVEALAAGILVPMGRKNPTSTAEKDIEYVDVNVAITVGETTTTYVVNKGTATLYAFKSWSTSNMGGNT